MYFSRITFNPLADNQKLAKTLCQDSYQEHQILWQLFNSDPDAKRDFLYRQTIESGRVKYYVLSERKPVDQSGIWLVDEPKPYDPKLSAGQKLFFSLRANPVASHKVARENLEEYLRARANRNVKDKKKLTRKVIRHDVVMHEKTRIGYRKLPRDEKPMLQQLVQDTCVPWLQHQAQAKGFVLVAETVQADGYRLHKSYLSRQDKPIRYSTVDFHGVLMVTNPDKFRTALFTGIGKSKAFGCGLLLVKRI